MNASYLPKTKRTEADLTSRMEAHLSGSDHLRRVALVWAGYLVALANGGRSDTVSPLACMPGCRWKIVWRLCESARGLMMTMVRNDPNAFGCGLRHLVLTVTAVWDARRQPSVRRGRGRGSDEHGGAQIRG